MRHETWQYIIDWTCEMAHKYGGSVYEKNRIESWDWGQALCRQTYGPDWMKSDEFYENESIPASDPAPQRFYDDAVSWASGNIPDWVDVDRMKERHEHRKDLEEK